MKARIKKVPATTNNLTEAIINFLNYQGHFAFRVNNGAVYDPGKKVFRKTSEDRKGLTDTMCVLAPHGRFLGVEVKNRLTKDKASPEQNIFKTRVLISGGVHIYAPDYHSFIEWYKDTINNNPKFPSDEQ
jgi:hypothetical protein